MMSKKGIITHIVIGITAIGLAILGFFIKNLFIIIFPLVIAILYYSLTAIAKRFYEKSVEQLNKDTKDFQTSLNLKDGDDLIYLNEEEFKKLRKNGKLYRGEGKEPIVLGDNINDHTENSK